MGQANDSPEEALAQESTRPELLVPITLDYDVPSPRGDGQGIKIRDRFMWNANEPFLKPIDFATVMCNDIGIDVSHAQTLADLIQTQLDEAQSTIVIDLATDDSTPDDVVFSDEEVEEAVDEGVEPDCRIIINVSLPTSTADTSSTSRSSCTFSVTVSSGTCPLHYHHQSLPGTTARKWASLAKQYLLSPTRSTKN